MLPMLVVSVTGGAIVFLGSLGIGPFGFLRQETMLFRVDYWSAGLAMIAQNSIFGLGMDQYGNFYREYRNSAAATRNYFDRTANTAHNIPIDVAVGAGLVAGICFLLIMFISLYISLKYILTLNDYIGMTLGVVCIGFIFQQFVSINQIGTAVWGWIFMGLIVNRSSQSLSLEKVLHNKQSSLKAKSTYIGSDFNRPKRTRLFLLKITSKLIVVFLAGSLVINPLIRDAQFSRAVKKGDLERQWELAEAPGSNQFLMEFVLKNAVAQNDPSKILKYAQQTSNRYPRSFYAWSVRAGLITSTLEERKRALEVLRSLDPLNTDIPMSPIEG
jgi:hypothetical protein